MDGRAKILKENSTVLNGPSPAETAATEFRVRCFQPLSHLSKSLRLLHMACATTNWRLREFLR
jgi:hypothetical protein